MHAKTMRMAAGIACAAAAMTIAGSAGMLQDKRSQAKTAFTVKLPALDGQQLTATLMEVTYPPGGATRLIGIRAP